MKRKLVLGCLTPIIVLVGLGWWGFKSLGRAAQTPPHYEIVDRGDVEIKVTETGTIEPFRKVEIKSKVAGRITRMLVDAGSRVTLGQVLVNIDPTEIDSQVAQMQAQLDGATARLRQAEKGAAYQNVQTTSGVDQAEETLRTAQARLKVAEETSRAQPGISNSAVRQAEANLKSAQDALAGLQESAHPQAVVQAQSAFDEAKASADNSESNYNRQKTLLDSGFVSKQVVDSAKSEFLAMKARLAQAQKHLQLIEDQNKFERFNAENRVRQEQAALDSAKANLAQIPISTHEVDVARAAVAQARAQLRSANSSKTQDRMRLDEIAQAKASVAQIRNQLNEVKVHQFDTTLTATMAGTVTKRYIEQGELVTSGVSTFSTGTPVLQVADLSKMLVKMNVNEVDVQKIRIGLPVEIMIDSVKGVVFRGYVSKVAPAAVTAAGADQNQQGGGGQGGNAGVIKFAIEVTVDHPDSRLKPGMSAKCSIIIARRKNVLRLPNDGIRGDGNSAEAEIVGQTMKEGKPVDTFTKRKVSAGLRGDTHIEIRSGLNSGDKVKPVSFAGPARKAFDLEMN